MEIEVTGSQDNRDCNGTYFSEEDLRNEKYCFSRSDLEGEKKDEGCIYFDGKYWKLCQIGRGLDEDGWNYSQTPDNPDDQLPPLGKWVKEKCKKNEVLVLYDNLQLDLKTSFVKPAKK